MLSFAAGDVDRLVDDVADLRARVQALDVQVARLADLEREGLLDTRRSPPGSHSCRCSQVPTIHHLKRDQINSPHTFEK